MSKVPCSQTVTCIFHFSLFTFHFSLFTLSVANSVCAHTEFRIKKVQEKLAGENKNTYICNMLI